MNPGVDFSKVVRWSDFVKQNKEYLTESNSMHDEARNYIEFYNWCEEIVESYVGIIHPPIIGVFLFEIRSNRSDVDDLIWVIVGDIPPAYLTCEDCPNPATAIDGYVGAMSAWVEAAAKGRSVANLIPVNVPATKTNAEKLKTRLSFLDEKILSMYKEDL